MDKVLIRMIASDTPVPEVIFAGPQDKAEAMLFRIIMLRWRQIQRWRIYTPR